MTSAVNTLLFLVSHPIKESTISLKLIWPETAFKAVGVRVLQHSRS